MMKRVVVLVLLLCIVSSASAALFTWTNDTGNRKWSNPGNWDNGGSVPGLPGDRADIPGGIPGPIIEAGDSFVADLTASGAGLATVDIRSDGYLHSGSYNFGLSVNTTMTVDAGGEMEVEGRWEVAMEIGNGGSGTCTGIVNVNGLVWSPLNGSDTIYVGRNSGTGIVNIGTAGVLLGGDLDLGDDGSLDIAGGGRLELWGNHMDEFLPGGTLYEYINLSKMTKDGSPAEVSDFIRWSEADRTVILVPEPMTISLLGLGGLALIRRKR